MILDVIKTSLGIPLNNTEVDNELISLIEGAKGLLRSSGVAEKYLEDDKDSLVSSFILLYVTTSFGFKSDGSLKELPKHFDFLLKQIALTKNE